MPTYDYQCNACGHRFEKFQLITAAPVRKCPKCGKSKVKRLIGTGAGVIFKGSGFYITDYRDSSYKDKAKAESGASASTEGGNGQASVATPSAGAEQKPPAPAKKGDGKSSARAKPSKK